jgi:hypothetical protein
MLSAIFGLDTELDPLVTGVRLAEVCDLVVHGLIAPSTRSGFGVIIT